MKGFPIYLALIFTFLLGSHRGFVALWTGDSQEPAVVFPYRTESLPLADQKALDRGIQVQTERELEALLEDFLS